MAKAMSENAPLKSFSKASLKFSAVRWGVYEYSSNPAISALSAGRVTTRRSTSTTRARRGHGTGEISGGKAHGAKHQGHENGAAYALKIAHHAEYAARQRNAARQNPNHWGDPSAVLG